MKTEHEVDKLWQDMWRTLTWRERLAVVFMALTNNPGFAIDVNAKPQDAPHS